MTEAAPIAALRLLAEVLEDLGVRYYLGGSLASSTHGVPRASLDADVVADLEPDHVDRFIARLAPAYYIPVDRVRTAVDERRSFNLILDRAFVDAGLEAANMD